uniref:Reverse transcriptase Ty1/copia-type domain-containing protein n=1 Tax=Cryptomonas curvata TaxID=233186 RepID=A0A7S0MSU5_9CRYP|mmetsp:Transcript_53142/g.110837  ORF Transcript_53142/g.110837 Transcript_53142/m.110837 type:complete len:586 (+) Transcript_53142:2148-3905(+)
MIHAKPAVFRSVVPNPLFPLAGDSVLIPKTDQQAQKQPCAPYWNADKELCLARHRELHAHDDVDRPDASVQVLDTKWVFDLKINSTTRMIERFKTRIVANGQPQILGFDCFDVHAPTVPMCEIKLLLAIAAFRDMELYQMDTTTAFISAALKPGELIYCNPPRGVDLGLGSNGLPRVWKLNAPLEGTRPAAMRWTQTSGIPIQSFGFVPIGSGGAFWMYNRPPEFMLLCTHVDDFLIAATTLILAERFLAHYRKHHLCKFGLAATFVGVDVIRDRSTRRIYLSQATLIDRLLEQEFAGIMRRENLTGNDLRYNPGKELNKWEQLCPCATPFDYKMPRLSNADSPEIIDAALVHWMQVVVGTLFYILNTHPDLVHSVHQLARFVHNPGPSHIKALDHVLRYLAGTGDLCLIVGNWTDTDLRFLAGFHSNADASHKNVELDFRGITGIAVFAFGTLLLARSFVQDQVSASSCEAEYYAYSSGAKDIEYVRLLLRDLLLFPDDALAPAMLVDSEPAIAVSQGPTQRSRTKHIDFTLALCRDYVMRGRVRLEYCSTSAQIADMFTKQLGPGIFLAYRARFMGFVPSLLT